MSTGAEFFHDQHLNHIQFYDVESCYQKWRQNLPEKYPSMDVKKSPFAPARTTYPILCPADTQHTVASISYRMVLLTIPLGLAIYPPGEVNEQKKSRK